MGAGTFQVDVVGATREGREKLTAPRTSIRSSHGRLEVTVGPDVLHLERINRLGSRLIDQSQKMTVAASAIAEKKTVGHRS